MTLIFKDPAISKYRYCGAAGGDDSWAVGLELWKGKCVAVGERTVILDYREQQQMQRDMLMW